MKITAIKPQEKRKNRASIFLDGSFAFGVSENIVADFGLYAGKELGQKDLETIKDAENLGKAMEKAYRLISFRQRSAKEITERLGEKFEKATVEKALTKLKDYGYLNDKAFAESWVEERKVKKGKKALYFELLKKGINKEIIEEVLMNLDVEEEVKNATEAIKKKKTYLNLPEPERRQKITAFLARRGYSYDVIKKTYDRLQDRTLK